MKVGMRTPSLTKSVKARTTGRVKRAAKKAVNPVYGMKGKDYLTDPERAVKNKIYHTVTVDPLKPVKTSVNTAGIASTPNRQAKKHGFRFRPCYILLIMTIFALMALLVDISGGSENVIFWSVSTFTYFAIFLFMRIKGL